MSMYFSLGHSGVVAWNSGLKICRFITNCPDTEYHTMKEYSLGAVEEGMRSVCLRVILEHMGQKFSANLTFTIEEWFDGWMIAPRSEINVDFVAMAEGANSAVFRLRTSNGRDFEPVSGNAQELIDLRQRLQIKV